MELVHRVLWNNENQNFEEIQSLFKEWVNSESVELEVRSNSQLNVQQLTHTIKNRHRTILRSVETDEKQITWIDIESEDALSVNSSILEARALIKSLFRSSFNSDEKPSRGGSNFHSKLPNPRNFQHFANLIFNSDRQLTIICVAEDTLEGSVWLQWASDLVKDYFGVALVVFLDFNSGSFRSFNRLVGAGLALQPGEVRVFPPADPDFRTIIAPDPISASDIRSHKYVFLDQQILRSIQPYLVSQALPEECMSSLDLLQEIDSVKVKPGQRDLELDELRNELRSREQSIESLRTQNKSSKLAIQKLKNEKRDLTVENSDLNEDIRRLQIELEKIKDRYVEFAMDSTAEVFIATQISEIRSIHDAIENGRKLPHVEIPQNVSEYLQDLESANSARTWAMDMYRAFLSLEAYARSSVDADYQQWCKESASDWVWYANQIAMHESQVVKNETKFRQQRVLPVSTEVSSSGTIFMEAHLKFRGKLQPRIYFYDDTKGRSGKVHIGGIDPHHRWQNTTS